MIRLAWLFACLFAAPAIGQGTAADYQRADDLDKRWRRIAGRSGSGVNWLDGGGLWMSFSINRQRTFVHVDADDVVRTAATAEELGISSTERRLVPRRDWSRSHSSSRRSKMVFENRLPRTVRLFWIDQSGRPRRYGEIAPGERRVQTTYARHQWLGDFARDDLAGSFVAESGDCLAVFDEDSRKAVKPRQARERTTGARLLLRDDNLWWRGEDESARQLTTDGSKLDTYRGRRHLSPDGRRCLAFRTEPAQDHEVHLIESTPDDRLQPKLHSRQYLKPGDRIARRVPVLFDVEHGKRIAVDGRPFADAYRIDNVRWAADGSEVYCLYNRRGHQVLRLYAIDADTGAVRTVIDERDDKFVDYSQKTFLHWLANGEGVLWASERDGWNHLYHVELATGATRQITAGEWLVREVERVDEAAGRIWFKAFGIHPGQDPYHAHLARIDLDGGGLTPLTTADGTHRWQFSPDGTRLVVHWSRVDQPEVTELRDPDDGRLIAELHRYDVAPLLDAGFRHAERFVAAGRDGETDIHGFLITPSDFDPSRHYPVIEHIYAGPQDHHVPKQFSLHSRTRRLAELGFVVVRIDGMGTNWRHRAFHQVCWRNLKDGGLPDRIAWLRAAAATRPWLDLERVGIFGGSAGGQNALAALLHHGDFYKVAVSDCGCHDNRMDKIWWNEAWMGWPIGPWYADSSNATHAHKLTGKLLLTVGELDRNVDPASTMQVVAALIAADKDFDMIVAPGAGHGVGETPYMVRRRQDFFVRHLHGVEPRRGSR